MPDEYIKQKGSKCGAYALAYWYYKFFAPGHGTIVQEVTNNTTVVGMRKEVDLLYNMLKCENVFKNKIEEYADYSDPYRMMCCLLSWGCKPTLYLGPEKLPKNPNDANQSLFPNPIYQLKDILLDVNKTKNDYVTLVKSIKTSNQRGELKKGESIIAVCYECGCDPKPSEMHFILIYRGIFGYYGINPWSGIETMLDENDLKQYTIKTLKKLNSNETYNFYFTGSCIHIPQS